MADVTLYMTRARAVVLYNTVRAWLMPGQLGPSAPEQLEELQEVVQTLYEKIQKGGR